MKKVVAFIVALLIISMLPLSLGRGQITISGATISDSSARDRRIS